MYGSTELPQTIHFDHDPIWNQRFMSIQNAHDQFELKSVGFWTFIGLLMLVADFGWFYVRTIR
jgi:hypothetical protein